MDLSSLYLTTVIDYITSNSSHGGLVVCCSVSTSGSPLNNGVCLSEGDLMISLIPCASLLCQYVHSLTVILVFDILWFEDHTGNQRGISHVLLFFD